MMNRMGPPRLRAAATAALVVAPLLTGCSADVPPQDRETPESAALRVRTVAGADSLDERTRAGLEGAVGDVLSTYVVSAFLGEHPRDEFVRSFASFTSGAARDAAGDIDLLTASAVPDATSVRATDLDVRLSFLTQGRTVHGGTASVHFAFEATREDGSTQPLTLDGRFLLEPGQDTWSVFGYDVRFDDGNGRPVQVESGSASGDGASS
jgi:hypothetical protein